MKSKRREPPQLNPTQIRSILTKHGYKTREAQAEVLREMAHALGEGYSTTQRKVDGKRPYDLVWVRLVCRYLSRKVNQPYEYWLVLGWPQPS